MLGAAYCYKTMQLQFVRMTSFSLIPFVFSKVKQAQKCLQSFSFMSDDRLGQTHLKSTNLVIRKQCDANLPTASL